MIPRMVKVEGGEPPGLVGLQWGLSDFDHLCTNSHPFTGWTALVVMSEWRCALFRVRNRIQALTHDIHIVMTERY
jgi:hypothetical protein